MNNGAVTEGTEEGSEEAEKQEEVVGSLQENEGGDPLPLFIKIAGLKDPVSGVLKKHAKEVP